MSAEGVSFLQLKQNVSVFDFPIWFTDSLEPELSSRLKGLDAFPRHDRRFGGVSIQRSPINFGFGIGVPDRENDDVSLAIIDNGFGRRTHMQGACRQGFELVDFAEINLTYTCEACGATTTRIIKIEK